MTEIKHNRFLLFIYPEYYPSGGFEDLYNSFNSLEDAIDGHKEYELKLNWRPKENAHIFDCQERIIVWKNY